MQRGLKRRGPIHLARRTSAWRDLEERIEVQKMSLIKCELLGNELIRDQQYTKLGFFSHSRVGEGRTQKGKRKRW